VDSHDESVVPPEFIWPDFYADPGVVAAGCPKWRLALRTQKFMLSMQILFGAAHREMQNKIHCSSRNLKVTCESNDIRECEDLRRRAE
jgi:hypothetical protein